MIKRLTKKDNELPTGANHPEVNLTVAEFLIKHSNHGAWCSLDELWPHACAELMLWDESEPIHFCNLLAAFVNLHLMVGYDLAYWPEAGVQLEAIAMGRRFNFIRVTDAKEINKAKADRGRATDCSSH